MPEYKDAASSPIQSLRNRKSTNLAGRVVRMASTSPLRQQQMPPRQLYPSQALNIGMEQPVRPELYPYLEAPASGGGYGRTGHLQREASQDLPLSPSSAPFHYLEPGIEPSESYLNVISTGGSTGHDTGLAEESLGPGGAGQSGEAKYHPAYLATSGHLRQRATGRNRNRRSVCEANKAQRRASSMFQVRGNRNGTTMSNGMPGFKVSMPKIKDVNKIDRYSRIVFPVSYMIFNAFYWSFYTL